MPREREDCPDSWFCRNITRKISWPQVVLFIIMGAFTIGLYFSQFKAYGETIEKHEKRLTDLETHYDHVDQKLDDIIVFFKIPTHERNR